MNNSKKVSTVHCPKIVEILLTILLLHGEVGFIIAVLKLSALDLPKYGQISTEGALILLWMTLRSVVDMFMGLRFFFAFLTKPGNAKYNNWISYAMFATCFDLIFAVMIFQKHKHVGMEVASMIMDGLVKITITLIMNDLRKKPKTCNKEEVPLLA